MVARSDASMFGPYPNTYSYRLWSLANVWSNCQIPPLTPSQVPKSEFKVESPEPDSDRAVAGSPPLGPGGPYKCPQCGGAYPTQEQLERHETLHSPNTQTCKQCHKSFANVYRLQRHMISHDESALLRKFKCNDCDKAFKFKHHLKEHLRIHSGEKPFECGNCGKKFSHSGSYSSHMTSKKCLVMNLKMGRIKPNNPALNLNRSPSRKKTSAAMVASFNNNIVNGNGFLPILPKYNEAAAAALLASMTPQDGGFSNPSLMPPNVPFYIPPGMPMSPATGITPYTFPASINQFLERFASTQFHQRKIEEHLKARAAHSDYEDMIEEVREEDERRSSFSSDRELVMDIEEEDNSVIKREQAENYMEETRLMTKGTDQKEERYNTIMQSVTSSVTKHFYQASVQSPMSALTYPKVEPPPSPVIEFKPDPDALTCSKCNATFNHKTELLQHEQVLCGTLFRKHEGLAAQVAETLALNRIESEMRASIHSGVSASEDEDYPREERERKDSTDNEKKIRVRTAINDKQLEVLKEHYALNPRPNRQEFNRIAQQLGLDDRVIQVWFQNNRARLRRMTTAPTTENATCLSEQPLDLSIKKSSTPPITTPTPSPPCSSIVHSDSGEEAMNLSQKSSRSTTPYRNHQCNYSHSNCSSSDFRHSPSPGESLNGFRAPHNRGQNFSVMPMEKMMQLKQELAPSRSPLLNLHMSNDLRRCSVSPGYDKRSWSEVLSQAEQDSEDPKIKSKSKESRETEGQFVCDQCDKTFVKQSSLARHKYEHSGQRPYKCIECPKAFKHKHHLVEHKRLHTGEKPFQCGKCFKKFSHSGSYSQHMNHRYSYCKPYRE